MVDLFPFVANICLRLNEDNAIPNKAKQAAERVTTRSGLLDVLKLVAADGVVVG